MTRRLLFGLALSLGCADPGGMATDRWPETIDAGEALDADLDSSTADAGPDAPIEDAGPGPDVLPLDASPDGMEPIPPIPPMPADPPCAQVRITTEGIALNIRSTPSTGGTIVGTIGSGARAEVIGVSEGEAVGGITRWFEINTSSARGFVSGRWAECVPDEEPSTPRRGYYLPLACGTSARISQGNNTSFSHTGRSRFAYDFAIPRGTRLHAMADGRVIYVYNRTRPGDPCYNGGGAACIAKANQVWIRHADGSVTSYAHLNRALVRRGDRVTRGTPIGRSGSSGYSTGPHAHVARQEDCGGIGCQSIRLVFQDVRGDGRPDTGQRVTSGNCP